MKRSLFAILILLAAIKPAPARLAGIYFDDSSPTLLILGAPGGYEVGWRKSNGSIQYIKDPSTGEIITPGSRYECLWGAVFLVDANQEYVGGCSYNESWDNRFSYSWSAAQNRLTLTYTPAVASSQPVSATVLVQASDQNWFDLQLQLSNHYGYLLDYIHFPSDLVFIRSQIQEAYLPILPGIVLEPSFFTEGRSYQVKYPGYPGVFADFSALKTSGGQIALYSLFDNGPLRETWLGFWNDNEIPPYIPGGTSLIHLFAARLPDGQDWESPWLRVSVGQTAAQAAQAYRVDNGLDHFPSLLQKAASRYQQLAAAPLYRAVADGLNLPFSQYAAALLSKVPIPGILHPVCYQPGGHDQSQPDYLPPDPLWGTTEDLANMVRSAQELGFLVMPYTNPTWWDDESPTLNNLPAGTILADLAVIDEAGNPVYETYYHGTPIHPHGGYVMSPEVLFVAERNAGIVQDMTVTIPSDMLFEDQIGARAWLFDYNAGVTDPLSYIDGWIQHTRTYQDRLLHTELAFDRLAETETGFHGSVLLPERTNYTPDWWGTDTWHVYPLATMMARDKTLFYQHDLAPETFTNNKQTLSWNLAMGYQLSYDLVPTSYGGGLYSDWIRVVGVFQKYVLSTYAGQLVTDYQYLNPAVTQTSFETCSVTANWSDSEPYATPEYTLPPQGSLVKCAQGLVTAGVFTAYNDQLLSAGDHYLVELRQPGRITVFQPSGSDTSLTLTDPPLYKPGDPIAAKAYTLAGDWLGDITLTLDGLTASFTYPQLLSSQTVGYVQLSWPVKNNLLPLISR